MGTEQQARPTTLSKKSLVLSVLAEKRSLTSAVIQQNAYFMCGYCGVNKFPRYFFIFRNLSWQRRAVIHVRSLQVEGDNWPRDTFNWPLAQLSPLYAETLS